MSGWVLFTAGRGPGECCLAVAGISRRFVRAIDGAEMVETTEAAHGLSSALVRVRDGEAVLPWMGTLEWVCKSPLRPGHGRKRWFIGATLYPEPQGRELTVLPADLAWETMRASGPGGQHVNKTESAVRLRHVPSGFVVTSSSERSQHRNRALALAKMRAALAAHQAGLAEEMSRALWGAHDALVRGNPVMSFTGPDFTPSA